MNVETVKRDRIGVLASTIVKELAADRIREIEKENVQPVDPPIKVTDQMRRLLKQFADGQRLSREADERVAKLGYRIVKHCDEGPQIARPYVNHNIRVDTAKQHRAARVRSVREKRTEALIELVTLDPLKAKAAVKAFRAAIEKV